MAGKLQLYTCMNTMNCACSLFRRVIACLCCLQWAWSWMFDYIVNQARPTLSWSTGPHAPTDWPIDRPTVSVPFTWYWYVARAHTNMRRRHATLMWTVQCVVVIATRLRTPTMGKRKAETPAQRTVRLERERDQRTSSYLHFLSVSPSILEFYVRQFFSPVTSHKPFLTLSYIRTTCAHCILDKTSHTCNAYGRA